MTLGTPVQVLFRDRVSSVRNAIQQPLLIDKSLTDTEHNQRAALLRNGLMVVAFTSLEDFIRGRLKELMAHVSQTVLRFAGLPPAFQNAVVLDAMRAGAERARLAAKAGDDPLPIAQDVARSVASTASGSVLSLSAYSFAHSGANVSSGEVEQTLAAFHVSSPWDQMTRVAGRCGAGTIDLRSQYDQAMRARNAAAHDVHANTQPSDLENFCDKAIAIALAFDLLASEHASMLRLGHPDVVAGKIRRAAAIALLFLDDTPRGFAERTPTAKRAARVSRDHEAAQKLAVARAARTNSALIERDRRSIPRAWVAQV